MYAINIFRKERMMSYLENQLCVQLYIKTREVIRFHEKQLKQIGLTYPKALVLLCLDEKNPCFMDRIGTALCLETGTLTPLLKKLVAEGYIHKQRDDNDERRIYVSLKPLGYSIMPKIKDIFEHTSQSSCLSLAQKNELLTALSAINMKGLSQ